MFREIYETTAEYLRREEENKERRRNRMIAEMADTRIDIYRARHANEVSMAVEDTFDFDPDKLIGSF